MSNFFSKSSIAMRFLSGLGALIIANFLFIITSIPIFTIGASLTALYRITFEIHMGNDPFVIRDYFRYFKENFKQATLVFVPSVVLFTVWGANLFVLYNYLDKSWRWVQFPVIIMMVIAGAVLVYMFPMIALYEQKTTKMLRDSALISIGNFPITFFIVISYVAKYLLYDLMPFTGIIMLSLYCFMGFAFDSWFFGFFINKAFKIEKPKEDREISAR